MQGSQFKAWRLGHGLTQESAANVLGVSVALVRDMEQGRYPVAHRTEITMRWIDLAIKLGASMDAVGASMAPVKS